MPRKNVILASVAGAVLILSATLWLLVLQPYQQNDARQAEDLLASGVSLFDEKKYGEALEVLLRVPAGSAQEAKALYYQGSAHMVLKDYEAAADKLEQALVLNNKDTGTLYALGVVYYKLGNIKLAKGYFAAMLEINPNDETAKGLMDIMAGLERKSVTEPEKEGTGN